VLQDGRLRRTAIERAQPLSHLKLMQVRGTSAAPPAARQQPRAWARKAPARAARATRGAGVLRGTFRSFIGKNSNSARSSLRSHSAQVQPRSWRLWQLSPEW